MDEESVIRLMHMVRYRVLTFSKGEHLVVAGSVCRYAHIVVSGEMSAGLIAPSGRAINMSLHHSGNMLAPAFLFANDNTYPVTIEAKTEARVLRLLRSDIERLITAEEQVARNLISMLSNNVVFLTQRVKILSMNVREKIAFFLKEEMARQQTTRVHIAMSRQLLTDSFGIQKYSLQRCLSEMQHQGIIKVDGKQIEILKYAEL
ncbi:MAG: Crp/Fnr family transcriptional regulator [Prevotella sp.]|nr:Crp/Fnr family transcriptional regulator [Prevotella sp.]